ncbi:MAG TPA: hypothetical protein DCY48_01425 [Candidatus Magasanikbacteria bacterium]|nr:MAG: hypothetical protein A3I74_03890 [Candidatus Magasanikbacteria bacterium RIFCSPLOWO2_02_FULL_47_16]OGH79307.1 MAG: hypothetical protein A3C10_04430 [Candidatus Magasanikbacteria bacterium RIFCSPHIGHO2_02_FULL_48_18]OGH82206.1 MAG: hypothetical protein A3G08_00895 [Candidatus Magasanikbacteria bacterium RIFCSPLOWO2_12_FULL_47_9b]HAZ28417.1 hypothetical protein [Candidatus Magasanikbacteria bacterium]
MSIGKVAGSLPARFFSQGGYDVVSPLPMGRFSEFLFGKIPDPQPSISRRDFLRGKKDTPEKPPEMPSVKRNDQPKIAEETPKEKFSTAKRGISRRDFGKELSAGLLTAAVSASLLGEGCDPTEQAERENVPDTTSRYEPKPEQKILNPEQKHYEQKEREFFAFLKKLETFEHSFDTRHSLSGPNDRNAMQIEQLHDETIETFMKEPIVAQVITAHELVAYHAAQGRQTNFLYDIYERLASVRCHGIVCDTLTTLKDKQGNLIQGHAKIANTLINPETDYFSIFVEDYFPKGDDIQPTEIDPRIYWAFQNRNFVQELRNLLSTIQATLPDTAQKEGQAWQNNILRLYEENKLGEIVQVINDIPGGKIAPEHADHIERLCNNTKAQEVTNETLEETPMWNLKDMQADFKQLVSDPFFRKICIENKFTLAETYSLAKSVINYHADNPGDQKNHDIIDQLLAARAIIQEQEIVGPNTEQFISFVYRPRDQSGLTEPKSDPEKNRQFAKMAGVPESGIHIASNEDKDNDGGGKQMRDRLSALMEHSKGKTCLYFDTHGALSGIQIDTQGNEMTPDEIIESLAKRFIRCAKEGKPERGNLQDVTIVFDTCLGYDIILAMRTRLDELRRENPFLAHIPPEDIGIPTVVSLANAGSLLYGKKDVSPIDYFVTHGQSIKDGMTGKFLLQQYQPDNYIFGDTAVFAPQYGAKDQIMIEVAKRKQKKDEYSLPLAA